jgi:hypothetical protein
MMKCIAFGLTLLMGLVMSSRSAESFDAAPFALPLADGPGMVWEDPREIYRVAVEFAGEPPAPETTHLEYWGSRWPEQHLPKDREPGGGSVGWMELGNWYNGGWREADAEVKKEDNVLVFTFKPVNVKEFPSVKDYPATFRYTLKLRLKSQSAMPSIRRMQAFTDSTLERKKVRLAWQKAAPKTLEPAVFNGVLVDSNNDSDTVSVLDIDSAVNTDPNTFDRTLVTISNTAAGAFTFAVDSLEGGPLYLPDFGVAVLGAADKRDYSDIAQAQLNSGKKTLYQQVAERPEQTWDAAWNGMPPKKSHIYYPLGLDGGRQRFRLNANGSIQFRSNDHYLEARPGEDTPGLSLEPGNVEIGFGIAQQPKTRTLEAGAVPICTSTWERDGMQITQTAFVTRLEGLKAEAGVPPADATTVFMARLVVKNPGAQTKQFSLPISYKADGTARALRVGEPGALMLGDALRLHLDSRSRPQASAWEPLLAPGASATCILKIPYLPLKEAPQQTALRNLDFDDEAKQVALYWSKRMDQSARLITPKPVLNDFYRAQTSHLLVNCEREPNSTRRFARVGSFAYGAYGNESCMMVVDLDRRGMHSEARECLEAWLHYQGTVKLPGSFASQDGIFYGAGGYESGGYNQHHGWILWCMAEHYRFTRDQEWLRHASPGIIAAADWIIRETARTADRHPLEQGLLPAGSLEDIGDWWTWLSTSCYTWRGLDAAAWALAEIGHPEAARLRTAADNYHERLIGNFRLAAERSPVVRLRNGTSVPHIPSHVHRRGRSFGWICETLEGAIHLLITGALPSDSPEALWIINDYEDNLYLSNQYGYTLNDFERYWFSRGGMSMQACLLLNVEPFLYRDDPQHALRAIFNAIAVSHFPDVHMNTEHALPDMGDWTGDHFKSSDESNATGWLRHMMVREEGDTLLVGQVIPRDWLAPRNECGIEKAATYFGPMSVLYSGENGKITANLQAPTRNPPKEVRVRFRVPDGQKIKSVLVNGKRWKESKDEWVSLPGDIGSATIEARY